MKKIKASLIINILIVFLVILATIFLLTDFNFMPVKKLLIVEGMDNFKFYTVDSNLLLAVTSLVLAIYELKLKKGKIKEIPNNIYLLKMVGTSAITLTFIITLFFLAPSSGFYGLYNNSGLLYHMIVPLLALISYIFLEKHDNKYKYAFLGVIPMFLYALYYVPNVILHKSELVSYDFYNFLRGDYSNIYYTIPVLFLMGYLISLLIIFANKKFAK